jgi:hypothetical protein
MYLEGHVSECRPTPETTLTSQNAPLIIHTDCDYAVTDFYLRNEDAFIMDLSKIALLLLFGVEVFFMLLILDKKDWGEFLLIGVFGGVLTLGACVLMGVKLL